MGMLPIAELYPHTPVIPLATSKDVDHHTIFQRLVVKYVRLPRHQVAYLHITSKYLDGCQYSVPPVTHFNFTALFALPDITSTTRNKPSMS